MSHVCILVGGPNHKIKIDGKILLFEDHPYCGPTLCKKNGDIKDCQPGPRHKFWKAVTWWYAQGKQLDADGFAIWNEPPPEPMPRRLHLWGRNYLLLGDGQSEEDAISDLPAKIRETVRANWKKSTEVSTIHA